MRSVSHARRPRLALIVSAAVADHVEQNHARVRERSVALRRLHVVPAAVGVIGAGPVEHGFLAVEEHQIDRERRSGAPSARAPARAACAALEPPSLAPTNRNSRNASCRSGRRESGVAAAPGNAHADIGHRHRAERRLRVERLLGGGQAESLQLRRDVCAGLAATPADPAGRGPMATSARMCSKARRRIEGGRRRSAGAPRFDRGHVRRTGEQHQENRENRRQEETRITVPRPSAARG